MARIYAALIRKGIKTLEDVPRSPTLCPTAISALAAMKRPAM